MALEPKDAKFRNVMQRRLGISPLPSNMVWPRCQCAKVTSAADSDHTTTCTSVQGKATMRHDILKGILRRGIRRAGTASTLEPTLRRLPGLDPGACNRAAQTVAVGLEARGDILLTFESGMSVVDVFITHPAGVANLAAAVLTDGAAAAWWDSDNRWAHNRLEPHGFPFIPFSVDTYGRLGKHAISLLGQLAVEAGEAGWKVRKSGFVAAAIRELSVRLCRRSYQM
jgi:hypothetical protein